MGVSVCITDECGNLSTSKQFFLSLVKAAQHSHLFGSVAKLNADIMQLEPPLRQSCIFSPTAATVKSWQQSCNKYAGKIKVSVNC